MCRIYRYIIGALNSKLSSKSSMPPMPGKNRPESFTPASRLKSDSIKIAHDRCCAQHHAENDRVNVSHAREVVPGKLREQDSWPGSK